MADYTDHANAHKHTDAFLAERLKNVHTLIRYRHAFKMEGVVYAPVSVTQVTNALIDMVAKLPADEQADALRDRRINHISRRDPLDALIRRGDSTWYYVKNGVVYPKRLSYLPFISLPTNPAR
jgi:hypothetical protein